MGKRLRFNVQQRSIQYGQLLSDWGNRLQRGAKNVRSTSRSFLDDWSTRLGIDRNKTPLKYERQTKRIFGRSLLLRQQIYGYPVHRGWLRIDLNPDGDVTGFSNQCVPARYLSLQFESQPSNVAISAQTAVREAKRSLGWSRRRVETLEDPSLRILAIPSGLRLCWKASITAASGPAKYTIYIDAYTGRPAKKEELLFHTSRKAFVFSPNPIVSLNKVNMRPNDLIPESAYFQVVLEGLQPTGYLDGEWVTTAATPQHKRMVIPPGDITVRRGEKGFEEVMAYHHIDAVQRRLRGLGITTAAAYPVAVNVHASTGYESMYDSQSKNILLATGGGADAEDAEIIVHEYGHALHDSIIPGFGLDSISRPLAEGFADYLAASTFNEVKGPAFQPGLASWDSLNEGLMGAPPFLRKLNNAQTFASATNRIEHWSSCLWNLRQLLGRDRGDLLAVGLHYYVVPNASAFDAAMSVLKANRDTNGGEDEDDIIQLFRRRGVFV